MGRFIFAAALAALALSVKAQAATFVVQGNTYDVQTIAGSGTNRALLEVDFGTNAVPQPYVFGYAWDGGAPSARDMMLAVAAADNNFTFTETDYGSFGFFLNTLWYGTNQPADAYPDSWWALYTSPNGASWDIAQVGYSSITLADGSFVGWAHETSDPNFPDYITDLPYDHTPAVITPEGATVPEPASLSILICAGGALMLRRRR